MSGPLDTAGRQEIAAVQSGTWTVTGPLTDTQLRATAVPVSIADGSASTLGAKADSAATSDTGTFSIVSLLKRGLEKFTTLLTRVPASLTGSGNLPVSIAETSATVPVSGTLTVGGSVTVTQSTGTNLHCVVDSITLPPATNAGAAAKTSDFDTGAGTDTVTLFGLALPASGGAVVGGTSSNPLRTDPTGTTTQPVSASSLPLPSGAATAANQSTVITHLATLTGAVSGTEVQVDVLTLPTIAQLPTSLVSGRLEVHVGNTASITSAQFPTGLVSGRFDVNLGAITASNFPASLVSGRLDVNVGNTATVDTELPAAAAISSDGGTLPTAPTVGNVPLLYNGATLDVERRNQAISALSSAARTTTTNTSGYTNHNAKGVVVYLNVTVAGAGGSLNPVLQFQDPISGTWGSVMGGTSAITTTGLVTYEYYPGADGAVALSTNRRLPLVLGVNWRIQVQHATAHSYTYSLAADLIV